MRRLILLRNPLCFLVPLICGGTVVAADALSSSMAKLNLSANVELQDCVTNMLKTDNDSYSSALDLLDKVPLHLHRNGDGKSCADLKSSKQSLATVIDHFGGSCNDLETSPYILEAFLTVYFAQLIESSSSFSNGDSDNDNDTVCMLEQKPMSRSRSNIESVYPGFYGHCDRGSDHTVVQLDHKKLVRTGPYNSLPCRFYTREGVRITSLHQFIELVLYMDDDVSPTCSATDMETCKDNEAAAESNNFGLHVYAAPAGRVFMFPASYIGERFELHHVTGQHGEPISLEVLSLEPRVFDIYNFFSRNEAQALIDKALSETSETHKMHRSTTGTVGASVFDRRTSENAWDTSGALAQKIKRRCFSVLGLDRYYESMSDGLQILRYNLTTAYVPHHDYFEDTSNAFAYDYDPSGKGGNRFATILLYMTDLPENGGGQTVFSRAWAPDDTERLNDKQALAKWREKHSGSTLLEPDSWQEKMASQCDSRLSVRPHASRAVLFYSQAPNGVLDPMSLHGGCPVLNGTKWAANLWAWNAPRPEFQGGPLKKPLDDESTLIANEKYDEEEDESSFFKVLATFKNTNYENAAILFDTEFFADLPKGETVKINTYAGHYWNVVDKDNNDKLITYVVVKDDKKNIEVTV